MEEYYLAIDIGASGGRHILAHLKQGRIVLEEIYRFPNGIIEKNGSYVWDIDSLFEEILKGMKKCKAIGKIPVSVGIDTWAVDFLLLDRNDKKITEAVSYRDKRTEGMDRLVYEKIPEHKLYQRTGIQKQIFNTIYQMQALQLAGKIPEDAETFLMIPDYFHFLLTGKKAVEYTNATTTQLVSPVTKDWDDVILECMGIPGKLFPPIAPPGTVLGFLKKEIIEEVGYDCQVVLPATHDTASAVAAVPETQDDMLYISSGTWSLIGTERREADCSVESRQKNLTNEGGVEYRFRYLKNIMGLWMIQSLKKECAPQMSYAALCQLAASSTITSIVDCNDHRFLHPVSMAQEVKLACEENGMEVPQSVGDMAAVIYNSLAECYAKAIREIEEQTGKRYGKIHIVGGGSNAEYLNEITARRCHRKVLAGPTEATAIGNLLVQLIAAKRLGDVREGRELVARSFEIKEWV